MEALSQTKNWNWYLGEYVKIENKLLPLRGFTEYFFLFLIIFIFIFFLTVNYEIFWSIVTKSHSTVGFFFNIIFLLINLFLGILYLNLFYFPLFRLCRFIRHQELIKELLEKHQNPSILNIGISPKIYTGDDWENYKNLNGFVRRYLSFINKNS